MDPRPTGAADAPRHANVARMYDYFLGGAHHFAVDREMAEQVAASHPQAHAWARGNRAFLMRAVRFCVEQGIRQFLDLGSGIPTADHVHTTARGMAPDTRVAYVDVDPVAVAYSRDLLTGIRGVSVTSADLRDPGTVLSAPTVTDVIDFGQPVAVLLVAVMHYVAEDDRPDEVLDRYREVMAPGSYLAMTHGSNDYDDPDVVAAVQGTAAVLRRSATPGYVRDRARLRELFAGHPLVEPGLVDIAQWRSGNPDAPPLGSYAALCAM